MLDFEFIVIFVSKGKMSQYIHGLSSTQCWALIPAIIIGRYIASGAVAIIESRAL